MDWIMQRGLYMLMEHNKTMNRVCFELMLTLRRELLLLSCSQMVFWDMMFASLVCWQLFSHALLFSASPCTSKFVCVCFKCRVAWVVLSNFSCVLIHLIDFSCILGSLRSVPVKSLFDTFQSSLLLFSTFCNIDKGIETVKYHKWRCVNYVVTKKFVASNNIEGVHVY